MKNPFNQWLDQYASTPGLLACGVRKSGKCICHSADESCPPEKVELLSYHRMAIEKWKEIHKEYKYKNIPEPDEQVMKRLQKLVNSKLL